MRRRSICIRPFTSQIAGRYADRHALTKLLTYEDDAEIGAARHRPPARARQTCAAVRSRHPSLCRIPDMDDVANTLSTNEHDLACIREQNQATIGK